MSLWLFIASLTGFAVFGLLWPLSRPVRAGRDLDDRDFYQSQLAEIDQDIARGVIDEASAASARHEAARRLLALGDQQAISPVITQATGRRRAAAILTIACVPLLALALYTRLGSPGLPDQPIAARAELLSNDAALSTLISKVEARLETHPEDGLGWATIAPVYVSVGRYADGITAFTKAIALMGESGDLLSGLGEARMATADGIVTTEALRDFDRALVLDPTNERAQYYRAMAAEQDGDTARALSLYQELAKRLPPDSEPAQLIAKRMAALGGAAAPAVPGADTDQGAMIRSMVQRLDEKLKADGSDIEGWLKLMRAYQVLGDGEKAKEARDRAKRAQSNDSAALARIDAAARDLGLMD